MNRRQFLAAAAAAPLLVRSDPQALADRVGGAAVALVTADTEAEVVALRLSDGTIHSRIRTRPGPRSIQTVGDAAVIAHTAEGAVTVLDGAGLHVRAVVTGFDQPRYTAGSRDGRLAYVTDSGLGEVVALDLTTTRILSRTTVYGPARHVTVSPSGRTLWVSLGSSARRIAVLSLRDPRRPRLARFVGPPFLVHDVGFEPGGRRVWVTSGENDERSVLVYDAASHRIVRRLHAGAAPQHVTFLAGNAQVSSGDDGTIRLFSLRDGELRRTTEVPLGSFNMQEAAGVVLTPSLTHGTLCVLDRGGRVRLNEHVAASAHDASLVYAA